MIATNFAKALCIAGLAGGGLALTPAGSGQVAAIFPPWWQAARTFQAAASGGAVLQLGGLPFIAIVAPADAQARARLLARGAWFFMDTNARGGCTPIPKRPTKA